MWIYGNLRTIITILVSGARCVNVVMSGMFRYRIRRVVRQNQSSQTVDHRRIVPNSRSSRFGANGAGLQYTEIGPRSNLELMFTSKRSTVTTYQDIAEFIRAVFFRHDHDSYPILVEHFVSGLLSVECVISDWSLLVYTGLWVT